jgi:hypothetical protein
MVDAHSDGVDRELLQLEIIYTSILNALYFGFFKPMYGLSKEELVKRITTIVERFSDVTSAPIILLFGMMKHANMMLEVERTGGVGPYTREVDAFVNQVKPTLRMEQEQKPVVLIHLPSSTPNREAIMDMLAEIMPDPNSMFGQVRVSVEMEFVIEGDGWMDDIVVDA